MTLRQDYIGRLVQQLLEALARAAKLRQEGELEQAQTEIIQAEVSLALPRGIERFDARSAALVIGNGDKVVLAALLLEERALLHAARGDAARAGRLRARARALLEHARPHDLRQVAAELGQRLTSCQ